MSKKGIKKSLHRSFRKSAEYSAALVFGVLFLVSSVYSVPNFSVTKSANTSGDTKNLKTSNAPKLDSSYKRYCDSDDHEGVCNYIAINDDALLNTPLISASYKIFTSDVQIFDQEIGQSIRAPPASM